jgi:hypothetical protein
MSKWLPDGKYLVYGVAGYREVAPNGCPNLMLKIGLTASTNPLTRIRYRGSDEPYPITDAFPKVSNIDYVICSCKEEAKWLEETILDVLREPGRPFHDRAIWNEPVNKIGAILCGITEMCPWSEDKCCLFLSLLQAYIEGRLVWKQ